MDSILNSIKKNLGIDPSYTHFDDQLIFFINSVFGTCFQLGVGPKSAPYKISSASNVWSEFLPEDQIETIKTYVYAKVKLIFDPPANSFTVDALQKICDEFEWRGYIDAETH